MGEVFLAEDTRLDRKVALKVLPHEVAAKQERMARFVREAKSAAALNHPNIAHVYEIDEIDGEHFIAMEFIDGNTLRQKIHSGSAELVRLLRYLQQVAEGLAKAHAAGIIHRDLKPDNIMITRDGYAKILDFGLAKLIEPQTQTSGGEAALSEVATAMMPQHSLPGTVMGTIGYMSPEQAQGRVAEVDHRSDIFAFGCLLYEAATGQKAFKGKDALDSLHNIVHAPTPQIRDVNPVAPEELQRIVRRCLAKDPEKRYQSVKDVAIELDELRQDLKGSSGIHDSVHHTASETSSTTSAQSGIAETMPLQSGSTSLMSGSQSRSSSTIIFNELKRHKVGMILGLLALSAVVTGAIALWLRYNSKPESPMGSLTLTRLITGLNGTPGEVSISPDGKYVSYSVEERGKTGLWVRQVSQDTSLQIVAPIEQSWFAGTTFSHDNELIYFVGGDKTDQLGSLYQIPVLGGKDPKKILEHVSGPISLSPDGKQFAFIRVYQKTGESVLMSANIDGTGEPKKLASRSDQDWFSGYAAWSHDGRRIACSVGTTREGGFGTIVEIPAEGGAEKAITDYKWSPATHRLLWLKDDNGLIMSAALRNGSGQIWHISYPDGKVKRITNDLNQYGTASLGVSADSTVIASILGEWSSRLWLTGEGFGESEARKITNGKRDGESGLAWLPDGRLVYSAEVGEKTDLWIMNADGSATKALITDSFADYKPVVSPDGRYIVFHSFRPTDVPHIWRINTDGTNLRQLTNDKDDYSPTISPDGHWVVFHSWRNGKQNLWKVSIDGGEAVQLSDLVAGGPVFSRDGKLISCGYFDESVTPPRIRPALISFETGQLVKVLDLPTTAMRPEWSLDGRDFIFIDTREGASNLWSQPVTGGTPRQLTKFSTDFINNFSISPDGRRFAVSRRTGNNDIVLIKNFQ